MDDRALRARARRGRVTITKKRLGDPDDDVIAGPKAVGLVHQLTLAAWAWTGQPLPKLRRSELPIKFIRGRRT